jgi:hypothetical protein
MGANYNAIIGCGYAALLGFEYFYGFIGGDTDQWHPALFDGIIVTSSIGLRTAISPRWMAFVGYALALVMLLTIADFAWIALVFPSWVLLLSAYILFTDFGRKHQVATRAEAKAPHEGTAAGD